MAERIWLDVPYAEKDRAKQAGARWDAAARRWYAPRGGMAALEAWSAAPDVPDLLPGEDRSLGEGLFVDLVPDSCWFTNIRSCVSPRDWERLRRMVIGRAGMRCEVCGAGKDRKAGRRLEAHERWLYDDAARAQRLKRLICLCTSCHTVTHHGYAAVRGLEAEAFAHLVKVTGMSDAEAHRHVDAAFALWTARSRTVWSLDLSILTDAGIKVRRPPSAQERPGVAVAALAAERGAALPGPTSAGPRSASPRSARPAPLQRG